MSRGNEVGGEKWAFGPEAQAEVALAGAAFCSSTNHRLLHWVDIDRCPPANSSAFGVASKTCVLSLPKVPIRPKRAPRRLVKVDSRDFCEQIDSIWRKPHLVNHTGLFKVRWLHAVGRKVSTKLCQGGHDSFGVGFRRAHEDVEVSRGSHVAVHHQGLSANDEKISFSVNPGTTCYRSWSEARITRPGTWETPSLALAWRPLSRFD